ncbi:MAG: Purine nucleoside phosphoramidase [Candidatus Omnitrophica bacterium]|nr:Purine nucleoside phosphoramidase [Candidatus Omnitrophota bacterium]
MGDADCLFCGIVERRIPAEIVHEDPAVVAFKDIHPQAPTHLLFVPRTHLSGPGQLTGPQASVAQDLLGAATRTAERFGLDRSGYRLVLNQGRDGGQTVGHLHVHLLGGRPLGWPPG